MSGHSETKKKVDAGSAWERRRADIDGMLALLHSARASAERYCSDCLCARALTDCIDRFCSEYGAVRDLDRGEPSIVSSPAALLRLLDYLLYEITKSFSDQISGEKLESCIAHFIGNSRLSREQVYADGLLTNH